MPETQEECRSQDLDLVPRHNRSQQLAYLSLALCHNI